MPDAINPLSPDQLKDLDDKIALADETEKAINKAVSAGVDVGDSLLTLREAKQKLVQLKRTYNP